MHRYTNRIKELREALGFDSYGSFAKKIGTSSQNVQHQEKHAKKLSMEYVDKISSSFGLQSADILNIAISIPELAKKARYLADKNAEPEKIISQNQSMEHTISEMVQFLRELIQNAREEIKQLKIENKMLHERLMEMENNRYITDRSAATAVSRSIIKKGKIHHAITEE